MTAIRISTKVRTGFVTICLDLETFVHDKYGLITNGSESGALTARLGIIIYITFRGRYIDFCLSKQEYTRRHKLGLYTNLVNP